MTDSTPLMDEGRFQVLADAYGADIRRWPTETQASARAFMDSKPTISKAILHDARALDEALRAYPIPRPSHALRARVLDGAPRRQRGGQARTLRSAWFRLPDSGLLTAPAIAVLAAALVGGVAFGFANGQATTAREAHEAFMEFAFADADTVFNIDG